MLQGRKREAVSLRSLRSTASSPCSGRSSTRGCRATTPRWPGGSRRSSCSRSSCGQSRTAWSRSSSSSSSSGHSSLRAPAPPPSSRSCWPRRSGAAAAARCCRSPLPLLPPGPLPPHLTDPAAQGVCACCPLHHSVAPGPTSPPCHPTTPAGATTATCCRPSGSSSATTSCCTAPRAAPWRWAVVSVVSDFPAALLPCFAPWKWARRCRRRTPLQRAAHPSFAPRCAPLCCCGLQPPGSGRRLGPLPAPASHPPACCRYACRCCACCVLLAAVPGGSIRWPSA